MNDQIFLSVVAPVFNEEDNIESVLTYWNSILDKEDFVSEIVLTNDGSTDNTAHILARLENELPRLNVITYAKNGGYGRALSSSINNSSGKWVVTIDSDGQFDLKDYRSLLDMAKYKNLDCATGFRKKKQDTLFRVFADRVLNKIVRMMFHIRLRDTNCALKVIKGELIRKIKLEARGYPTPTEIIIKIMTAGGRLGEAGVNHIEREAGLSKLKPIATGINFLQFLFYLRTQIKLTNKNILQT